MQDKPKILVVDDDVAFNLSLVYLVEHIGMRAVRAYNGHDALQAIQTEDIDAVISDVRMPRMTGIELLRELKRLKESLPVIIMSGDGSEEMVEEAMENGAFAFLEKTGQRTTLISTLKAAVELSKQHEIPSGA